MNFSFLRVLVAACLFACGSASAQIPVTDVASLTQQVQQVAAWAQQYKQMVDQYQQMTQQLAAIKGARGMGQLLNVAGVRQSLPDDFVSQFDQLRNLGVGGASPDAIAIYDSIKKYSCDQQFPNSPPSRLQCQATAMALPSNIATINKALTSSKGRMGQLQGLMSQIDGASDIKAASDLSNRINMEVALLQNEKMMMDMALASYEQQAKLVEQQKKEAGVKRLTERGTNPFNIR